MSTVGDLLAHYCPEGVPYKALETITNLVRGQNLTKDMAVGGQYPVVTASREASFFHHEFNHPGNAVSISSHGAFAGFVSFWPNNIWLGNNVFLFDCRDEINTRFLFFILKSRQSEISALAKSGGVPYINASQVQQLAIPVPPMEVQLEIVRILDIFTALEAELEAELEARKKQYEFYRNQLLTFPQPGRGVRWVPMGEFATLVRGNGMPKTDFSQNGVPAIHYGQIYTHYGTAATRTISFVGVETASKLAKVEPGDIVITNTSENIEDVGKAVAWLGDETAVTGGHATVIKHQENPQYLAYYFQTHEFASAKKKWATGTKVIDVSAKNLAKIEIPLPSRADQDRIAALLKNFELLVSDISIGLPAELAARRKQYAYYRNKLLTFREIEA